MRLQERSLVLDSKPRWAFVMPRLRFTTTS